MKKNFQKYGVSTSKDVATPPKAMAKDGKLYQRMGRSGENETNALEWIRTWKQFKMGEYPPELLVSLKDFVRVKYDVSKLIEDLKYESEVSTSKDSWTPTVSERFELSELEGDEKVWRERELFAEWQRQQYIINAEIKNANDVRKAQKDEIVKKGELRAQVIGKLMGAILADMTADSRKEVEQWTRSPDENIMLVGEEKREWIADSMDEAYAKGDWLFIFEAVEKTHLLKAMPKEDTAIQGRRDALIALLGTVKHTSGSYERWVERFEDQKTICETAGCEISDAKLRNLFMDGLNRRIFESILKQWKLTVGRPAFAETYEGLKAEIRMEYNAICADPERARVVAEVMFARSGKTDGRAEISLESKESSPPVTPDQKSGNVDDRECWICDKKGHLMKDCWYFDPKKTKEEMRELAAYYCIRQIQ